MVDLYGVQLTLEHHTKDAVRNNRRIIGVYRICSPVSEHCYVGSSRNVHARVMKHHYMLQQGRHHSRALQRAYAKYGDTMTVDILWMQRESAYVRNPFLLEEREQEFIDELESVYNGTLEVGAPTLDKRVAERISRSKQRSARERTSYFSAETIARMRAAALGRKQSDAHRAAISAALSGRQLSLEHSAKISAALKGKQVSEATRLKQSLASIGVPKSAAHAKAMGESRRGIPRSAETRAKISATRLAMFRGA